MTDAAIFMCDVSGQAAEPWAEAGWDCYCVDIQHSIRRDRVVQHGAGRIHFAWGDVRTWHPPKGVRPAFGVAMTPCTHVAGSGARDFRKKGGYFLRDSLEYYESARHGFEWAGIPYMMENSVGVLSNIPHIGKPDYYFHPNQFTRWCADDNYTKITCVWGGNGFVMPKEAKDETLGPPDDRIHKATPGDGRADFRSASPRGFFRAMHVVNDPKLTPVAAAAKEVVLRTRCSHLSLQADQRTRGALAAEAGGRAMPPQFILPPLPY